MTPTTSLLAEVRLLRRMGENGRTAAAMALRSARLGRRPEPSESTPGIAASTASTEDDDALKFMIHELDNAVVQRGGRSIFAAKPVGTLSAEAERRLEAWVFETPQRHLDAPGPKPNDRPLVPKPGRLVATLTGKLGGYASDRDGGGVMLRVLDLFSGIGGFSLGLERTGGFRTVAFCEIDPFCRRVLAKHWPDVRQYEDVRELTAERLAADGIAVDVITGGFPCQDISTAGKQTGMGEATRSGLWSEIVRLARGLRPRFIIVENVSNLLAGPTEQPGGWFGRVLGDLAEIGFDAEWHCIPASAVGAPHIRDRVWIIAHPQHPDANSAGSHRAAKHIIGGAEPAYQQVRFAGSLGALLAHADFQGLEGRDGRVLPECAGEQSSGAGRSFSQSNRESEHAGTVDAEVAGASGAGRRGRWFPEPPVGRVAHGIPHRVHRLRALGNAVVPQIPEIIGRAILTAEAAHA